MLKRSLARTVRAAFDPSRLDSRVLLSIGALLFGAHTASAISADRLLEYRGLCRSHRAPSDLGTEVAVCVSRGQPRIAPEGCRPREERVGSCVGVAPYYEKFGAYSPSVAHAFFAADEPPCAHDPGSAVATCKWHCGEIFGRRGYDTLQGRFVEMPPTDPRSLAAATLIDHPRFGDLTPHEACLDNCGPPNRMMPAPPFILDDAEMEDHWFFVTYHRWNPNQDLARWLRSYTVNPDKRTAPARVCQKLFDSYCENLLPEGIDRSRCSEEGAGSTGRGDAGQCEIFRHGKTLCPGICYRRGGDSIRVPEHICDRDDDLRCDAVEAVCLDR